MTWSRASRADSDSGVGLPGLGSRAFRASSDSSVGLSWADSDFQCWQ